MSPRPVNGLMVDTAQQSSLRGSRAFKKSSRSPRTANRSPQVINGGMQVFKLRASDGQVANQKSEPTPQEGAR